MFKKLKQNSLQKKTSKILLKRNISNRNTSLQSLGFLVDASICKDFETLYSFSKECNLRHKDVKIFSFKEVKKKLPTLIQNQINNKDFSWRGDLTNQNAKEFLDNSLDVLVGFYTEKNLYLDYMMASSKANFKIGFSKADTRVLDLILHVNPLNFDTFKSEFIKYLKILKKI